MDQSLEAEQLSLRSRLKKDFGRKEAAKIWASQKQSAKVCYIYSGYAMR